MNRMPIRSAVIALTAACAVVTAAPVFAQAPPPAPSKQKAYPKQRKPSPAPRIITVKRGQTRVTPDQLAKAPSVDQWQKTAKKRQERAAKTPRLRLPKSLTREKATPVRGVKR